MQVAIVRGLNRARNRSWRKRWTAGSPSEDTLCVLVGRDHTTSTYQSIRS